jgi:putative zinc finger/helix-turn-helix YgiT family protein
MTYKRKISKEVITRTLDASKAYAVRPCVDCGASATGRLQEYQYTECGLSSVKLLNVMVYRCHACGSTFPEIPAIERLHLMIAVSLLQKEALLSGEEVRFLRKVAGLTQSELAEIMGVHKTTPTGWETESEPIGKENDRVLRSCCFYGMMTQILTADDPIGAIRASSAAIKAFDIREAFKRIKDGLTGPKCVRVGNDPEATGPDGPWFLPENRTHGERCM